MYMHVNRATSTNLYMTEGGSPDEANCEIDADPRPAPQQFLCSSSICRAPKMFSKTTSL